MKKRVFLVVLAVIGVAIAGLMFAQIHNSTSLPDPVVELSEQSVTVPFSIATGRPIVNLRINGAGPFPFILDSGAEGTILTRALADELKLPVVGTARAGSPGATHDAPAVLVKMGKIELDGVTVSDGLGVALDLSSMPKVFSGAGAPVGALSMRAWKGLLVTLDYPASKVEIRRGALPPPDNVDTFEFPAEDRLPSVAIDLAGVPLRANLDSGSSRGVTLPRGYETQLTLVAPPVPTESLRTVSGEQVTTSARLKGAIKIGGHSVEDPDLIFVDEFPVGNLGYPVLQHFAITFDWTNHRLQLR